MTVLLKQSGIQNEYAVAVLYASANLPGNLASTLLVERVGGKRLLVFSMFLASACILALALVEISPQERETVFNALRGSDPRPQPRGCRAVWRHIPTPRAYEYIL